MTMRNSRWIRAFWWLFLVLFIASGCCLAYYLISAIAGGQAISSIGQEVTKLRDSSGTAMAESDLEPEEERASIGTIASDTQTDQLLKYYQELAATNPDLIGWVSIANTIVDYPVMYSPGEPQRYLHRDFQRHYSLAGIPFLDARCDPESLTENKILYAHNMRSGQMFAQLISYLEPEFLKAHPTIGFDTLTRKGDYTVFAVLQINLTNMDDPTMQCYRLYDTALQQDVDALNDYTLEYATVRTEEVQQYDRILTLSTCQHLGSIDRLVVMARQEGTSPEVTEGTSSTAK
jgi:sortase B